MRTQYLDKHQPSVKVKTILEMKRFKSYCLYTLSQQNPGTQQNNNNKNNQTKQKQRKNKQQPQVKE